MDRYVRITFMPDSTSPRIAIQQSGASYRETIEMLDNLVEHYKVGLWEEARAATGSDDPAVIEKYIDDKQAKLASAPNEIWQKEQGTPAT